MRFKSNYLTDEHVVQLVEDIKSILASPFYKGRIVKSDLVSELRQSFLRANVKLGHSWTLGAWFINRELDDLMEFLGYIIEDRHPRTNRPGCYFVMKGDITWPGQR